MKYDELAKRIVEAAGGKENITYGTHCVTRLRFGIADESKVQKETLKSLEGVMGITKQGEQLQIIVGNAVGKIYDEVTPLLNASGAGTTAPHNTKQKFSIKLLLDVLTSIISPIIPAFCAAGMMKCICLMLTTFGIATGTEGAYVIFDIISDIAFYFLPILIAQTSAKRFKVDEGLAICVAGALLYPSFIHMIDEGISLSFFGIPLPIYTYSATIFPALLGVLFLSKVYRLFDKLIKWDTLKLLLVPVLSLGVTIPLTYLLLAPLGNWGAALLANVFSWMISAIGPFAGLIIGALMPIMTLTGLHQSLAPIELMEMTTFGFTLLLTIEFLHNMSIAGATLGTAVSTKDKKFKAVAAETGFTAFIGISEPALYTVAVKDKNAMISAMIGNGVGGFLSIFLNVKFFGYIWPTIFSLPNALGGDNPIGNIVRLVICAAIAFITAFSLPFLLKKLRKEETPEIVAIHSPVKGTVIPLSEVNDETFSKGVCGTGVAVIPEEGKALSPCDGTVMIAMPHAVGLRTANGAEMLVHVGIETVNLNGDGLQVFVKEGDTVKSGELLIQFDKQALEQRGYDTTCIVVRTDGEITNMKDSGKVLAGEQLFTCSL